MVSNERQREYLARRMILTQLMSKGYIDVERYTRLLRRLDEQYKDVLFADRV